VRTRGLGGRADEHSSRRGVAREGSAFWFAGSDNYVRSNVAASVTSPGENYGFTIFVANTLRDRHTPIREFSGNEAYGLKHGLTYWYVGFAGDPDSEVGESVIKDFHTWHFNKYGIFNYPSKNIVIDGFVAIDDQLISRNNGSGGFMAGDYQSINLVIKNSEIQGANSGVYPSTNSANAPQEVRDSILANYHDIWWRNLTGAGGEALLARRVDLRNVRFDKSRLIPRPGEPPETIHVEYLDQPHVTVNFIQRNELFVYDYNGIAGDNFQFYFEQQDPDFIVPQTIYNADGTKKHTGSPVAGLTNQQNMEQFGIAIAGSVSPTRTRRDYMRGFVRSF
jgi:hypothetical protein